VIDSGVTVLLPERLDVHAQANVETLRRGLFEVPVYRSELRLTGHFAAPLAELGALVPREALLWKEAQLVLRIADVHGVERVRTLAVGGVAREFRGGTGLLSGSGLNAGLADLAAARPVDFKIDLDLRGSSGLFFTPTAKETAVALRSGWPHPKFTGAWLPDFREVTAQGFSASWKVTSLAGGFPPAAKREPEEKALASAIFGVELLNPVDPYRMSERSLKYNLLFIGLTFVVLWLFEQRAGRSVRAVQYLLVGASLCVFYLLELSLAEHLGFATAYAIAAGAVTAQVSLYARAVLSGWRPALLLMATVASLYLLLYTLLGAEDYALLVGSAVLFVALSVVMFVTRRAGASAEPAAGQ
jgi:inner membrane protein